MDYSNSSNEIRGGNTNNTSVLGSAAKKYIETPWTTQQMLLIGLATIFLVRQSFHYFTKLKAPFAGYRSVFEPAFLVRLRFVKNGGAILAEGYNKYKDRIFQVARNDRDIVVIPTKYIDELRSLPSEHLSAIEAHIEVCILTCCYCSLSYEYGDSESQTLTLTLTLTLTSYTTTESSRKTLDHGDYAGEQHAHAGFAEQANSSTGCSDYPYQARIRLRPF